MLKLQGLSDVEVHIETENREEEAKPEHHNLRRGEKREGSKSRVIDNGAKFAAL